MSSSLLKCLSQSISTERCGQSGSERELARGGLSGAGSPSNEAEPRSVSHDVSDRAGIQLGPDGGSVIADGAPAHVQLRRDLRNRFALDDEDEDLDEDDWNEDDDEEDDDEEEFE